ncbi:hypothetical protein Tco_0501524, partial [Tanacetum coccineum]
SLLKKEEGAFYMKKSKDEDAVLFVFVVVFKVGDEDEEEKISTKKIRTIGLSIEEVTGKDYANECTNSRQVEEKLILWR